LAATSYKYLDIGISVVPVSSVEIVIGNNRGNRIILPHATWEKFIARREDIERLTLDGIPVEIDNIIVKVAKMYNTHIVKLSSHDTSIYLKLSTILFLFKLDRWVEHAYSEICQWVLMWLMKSLDIL